MLAAFEESFQAGSKRVVLIGTDLPGLSAEIIESAFNELAFHEAVFGPANDGGYYLVALKAPKPGLFENMSWSTNTVLSETLERARSLGLSTALVTSLNDVDRPEDVAALGAEFWPAEGARKDIAQVSAPDRISVIIPTLNEETNLPAALDTAATGDNIEIIVVDGGSSDNTVQVARAAGFVVLETAAGRARQMNAGAREASGEILLFLHADTLLPRSWDRYVRSTSSMPGVCAGAFEFSLDSKRPGLGFIERAANFRSRSLQTPYGDQAVFMTRDTFCKIGGFAEIPIMEDLDMVRKLRRIGRIHTVPAQAITSARRWEKLGVWRTSLVNQLLLMAYFLGVSPRTLARWYSGKKGLL
jgi:rSAM/selenodomain-associated transferase 2